MPLYELHSSQQVQTVQFNPEQPDILGGLVLETVGGSPQASRCQTRGGF